MKKNRHLSLAAPTEHLQQLSAIRTILLGCIWGSLLLNVLLFHNPIPSFQILFTLCTFTILQTLTFLRLRNSLPVTQIEFFIQLLIDVIFLNILFYCSGGANNPFISYLLVPICISAATLSWRFTVPITLLCIFIYSLLLFFYIPFPIFTPEHNHSEVLNGHIIGMWFNFSISAILITYFVVKMAQSLRLQEQKLNQLREEELRNEQVIAVATLAASAAHEINTPLSTMKVLLTELQSEHQKNHALVADIELLSQQVTHCAGILKKMVHDSINHNETTKLQTIHNFCESILHRWHLMRPTSFYTINYDQLSDEKKIYIDNHIDHAVINILNNAADASPDSIINNITIENNFLKWSIIDKGDGINENILKSLGRKLISTKESGLGLGMLLSHSTIQRYGGSVIQQKNYPHGTITVLTLPLNNG